VEREGFPLYSEPVAVAPSQDVLPLYQQVARDIERRIFAGELVTGTRLPSVRDLAKRNGISRLTALKAYQELQDRGLLNSTVGRGTFVAAASTRTVRHGGRRPLTPCGLVSNLEQEYAAARVISFATGGADPKLFHMDEMLADIRDADEQGAFYAQHSPPDGDPQLIAAVATDLRQRRYCVEEDAILITGSDVSTKALFIHAFCGPGDRILVEDPAFPWAEGFYRAFGVEPVGIPDGVDGWDLQRTEDELRKGGVKAMLVSSGSHSSGRVQPLETRRGLLDLAERYGCWIVEDMSLSRIGHTDGASGTILSLGDSERVLGYECCTKMVAPAMTIAWAVCPPALKRGLCLAGLRLASRPPQILQVGLREMMLRGRFGAHLSRCRPRYRQRRDSMVLALQKSMPDGVAWHLPAAGYSLWLSLPEGTDAKWVTDAALERGVSVVPGELCRVPKRESSTLRVSFGQTVSNDIEDGVLILSQVIRRALER
jgi:DNA-binding transcriptional MocR family regulator